MSFRRISTIFVVVFLCIFVSVSFAQTLKRIETKQIVVPKDITKVKIQLKADLVLDWVYAEFCPCSDKLAATDTILIDNEMGVVVTNLGPAATDAKLKVKYFDKDVGSVKTFTKTFNFPANKKLWIPVRFGKFLIKKSYGMRATISIVPGNIEIIDPNLVNNFKKYKKCFAKALIK